jgi:hypothetical protein
MVIHSLLFLHAAAHRGWRSCCTPRAAVAMSVRQAPMPWQTRRVEGGCNYCWRLRTMVLWITHSSLLPVFIVATAPSLNIHQRQRYVAAQRG